MSKTFSAAEMSAIGWVNKARSYLDCAEVLWMNRDLDQFKDDPLDMLCAHGTELALKGCLTLFKNAEVDLHENYGHNLLKLWNDVVADPRGKETIAGAQKSVNASWKAALRNANGAARELLEGFGLASDKNLQKFGVVTNEQIGNALPKLLDAVEWLSQRHSINGSKFRYPWTGFDQRVHFQIGKFKEDLIHRTIVIGSTAICDLLETKIRRA